MLLIRYRAGTGAPQVGILDGDQVRPLPGVATMADLLARPVSWIRGVCGTVLGGGTLDLGDPDGTRQVSGGAQGPAGPGGPGRMRSRCGELPCWPPWTGVPTCGPPG